MGKDSKKHSKEKEKSDKHKKDHKHKSKHSHKDRNDDKHSSDRRTVDKPITTDDFFNKSEEFRVWLKITKDTFFEDLSSKDAHKLFEKEFMKDYNKGKLTSMYYDGNIPLEIRNATVKTQHKWAFKLSKNEETKLAELTEDVDHQTRAPIKTDKAGSSSEYCLPISSSRAAVPADRGSATDKRLRTDDDWDRRKEQRTQERLQQKTTVARIAEEVLPGKETGGSREQRRDQRKAVGEALHGAHRDKEEGRDGLIMPEKTLLGGDSREEYSRMLERERMLKERRTDKAQERARELQGRADEREMAFMQKLGIDPSKGRITIAPRDL